MYVVGFATAVEIEDLKAKGFEVEDAPVHCIGPEGPDGEGYLLTAPDPGPSGTKAVAIFFDTSLYDMTMACYVRQRVTASARIILANLALLERLVQKPNPGSLTVDAYIARRNQLREDADALRAEAENFKYCNHKNSDGSDARYPIGNGELACDCGNKWD